MNNEFLTKKELADTLKVSKRTIERHLQDQEGTDKVIFEKYRAFRIGKQWRFANVKENLTEAA